ncbi:M23 family metallopeptidase [Alkalicoccus luteus]|uniref:M23 family metallopeptidase n=1 Tax=Alkalicoccus luteus TaxID=1237094 RepID=A0A969PTU9_9BACI|nr:M23 family metallopeptidase [Alkalicoccus luteus]NJP39193.1 M23 family metallopeptidase [Alkalicoccus luteus]
MKKWYLISAGLLLAGCADVMEDSDSETDNNESAEEQEQHELTSSEVNTENGNNEEEHEEPEPEYDAELELKGDYVYADEAAEALDISYMFDEVDRSVNLTWEELDIYLVERIPVMEINGQYVPYEADFLETNEGEEALLHRDLFEYGFEADLEEEDGRLFVTLPEDPPSIEAEADIESMTPDEMVAYLEFLERPIEDAFVSTVESHLPGAPRDYRNGEHEGIDYYDYASGVEITTDTPIYAMAEGTVVRSDLDYEDYPSEEERDAELEEAAEVDFTPEYILDRLRGQQVWVQYDHGVMIRFAHLDDIPEDVEVGDSVDAETVIGYVGNSGTSYALIGEDGGLHLHKDLLIDGQLFWEPFTLEETADILRELWP